MHCSHACCELAKLHSLTQKVSHKVRFAGKFSDFYCVKLSNPETGITPLLHFRKSHLRKPSSVFIQR